MNTVETIHSLEQVRLLADPRRMQILRLLMAHPATLTQLAAAAGQSPAWVRHHLLKLETASLVELSEVRTTGKVTEKFYRARANAFLLQELILPDTGQPVVVFSGSHDIALEHLADAGGKHMALLTLPVGSLDGLANLRQGLCQLAGAHLRDDRGEYNISYVRHFFPDRQMEIVTLAHRTQGLMVTVGNPKGIRTIADLTRPDVTFVNRNPGSGTRLWLDREMDRQGLPTSAVQGYSHGLHTHSECAREVRRGQVDAALGLQAAAHQQGLDFVALFEERYDLVLPAEQTARLAPLLDRLQTAGFRRTAGTLTGYRTQQSGMRVPL
jgi:putative molybdopterin biosynthesis protein